VPGLVVPREVVLSEQTISVTKRFPAPEQQRASKRPEVGLPPSVQGRAGWRPGAPEAEPQPTTSRAGWDRPQAVLPPPPRISQEPPTPAAALPKYGKTLLTHFCEQAALAGQSLAKGEQLLLTWQRAGHTEDSLTRLLLQEQPATQSALQLLLVKVITLKNLYFT
jgi:hypothetical protein